MSTAQRARVLIMSRGAATRNGLHGNLWRSWIRQNSAVLKSGDFSYQPMPI